MLKKYILALIITVAFNKPAIATSKNIIDSYVQNSTEIGNATLSFLFFDVYKATLYAPNNYISKSDIQNNELALKLKYFTDIEGLDIAERTIEEMQNLGYKAPKGIVKRLANILPDVDDGDIITGIKTSNENTIFYLKNKKIGEINDAYFTKYFFGIWLNPNTSEKKLRKKLLGL